MFELNEAVRGRLIGPKSWDRIVIIFGAIFTVHGLCVWTVWAVCVMVYALNHVVMCMRPGSAEKYGFTKGTDNLCFERNRDRGFYCF